MKKKIRPAFVDVHLEHVVVKADVALAKVLPNHRQPYLTRILIFILLLFYYVTVVVNGHEEMK